MRTQAVDEAEQQHSDDGVPFGLMRDDWMHLKEKLEPGDQLWWFTRPKQPGLYGALEGYVVLRRCEQVNELVLAWD